MNSPQLNSSLNNMKLSKTQQAIVSLLLPGQNFTRQTLTALGYRTKSAYFADAKIIYNEIMSDTRKMRSSLNFKKYEEIGYGYKAYKMTIRRQYQESVAYQFADGEFFDNIERKLRNKIAIFRKRGNVKGYTNVFGLRNDSPTDVIGLGTKAKTLNNDHEITKFIEFIKVEYRKWMGGYEINVNRITSFSLNLHNYTPLQGSSYTELPKAMLYKKAIVNIKNDDSLCFLYAVLASLYPVNKNAERVSNYKKHLNELKYDDIEMPMKVSDITRFEAKNNLVINVYTYSTYSKSIEIVHHSKGDKEPINLFLYNNHYSLIKNWKLLFGQGHKGQTQPPCQNGAKSPEERQQNAEEAHRARSAPRGALPRENGNL